LGNNWTAFAPDFQALLENVEYIERDDEFDVICNTNDDNDMDESMSCSYYNTNGTMAMEQHPAGLENNNNDRHFVNVITIEPVPAFASDSEDEDQNFDFAPRVKNVIAVKGQKASRNSASNQDD
jgi:hypothetical protein